MTTNKIKHLTNAFKPTHDSFLLSPPPPLPQVLIGFGSMNSNASPNHTTDYGSFLDFPIWSFLAQSQACQILRYRTLATCNSGMVIPMQHVLVSRRYREIYHLSYKSSSYSQVCKSLELSKGVTTKWSPGLLLP